MKKEEAIDKLKLILETKINEKYKKLSKVGRPESITVMECLDAIFLCSC